MKINKLGIPVIEIYDTLPVLEIVMLNPAKSFSKSEAKRLIQQKVIKINDKTIQSVEDTYDWLDNVLFVLVGKKYLFNVILKER